MVKVVSLEQWSAIRALAEGALPTFTRLAACSGLNQTSIAQRSGKDGWKKLDCRSPYVIAGYRAAVEGMVAMPADLPFDMEDGQSASPTGDGRNEAPPPVETIRPEDMRARVLSMMPAQLARVVALAERGVVDKARLDALLAMVRVAERAEALAAEQMQEARKRSDEELAALLQRIDERIVELARAYADGLGGGQSAA